MSLKGLLGRLLQHARAGERNLLRHERGIKGAPAYIEIESTAFPNGGRMPDQYTRRGGDVFPPLRWTGVPADTRELVLVVEDIDAPTPKHPFVHLIAYAIAPATDHLDEGAVIDQSGTTGGEAGFKLGRNTFRRNAWMGPDPIPGHGPHHYHFQLFALDKPLTFRKRVTRRRLWRGMRGHVVAVGALTGTYERS